MFTLKVKLIPKDNHADKNKLALACIKRFSSPIPTKSQKKVNQISKYFQNIKLAPTGKLAPKSYTHVSTTASNTKQNIKIKDTFLFLGTKKINQIQNIIKGSFKLKPWIQITTKELSRKQVIILINGDNIAKFMKESLSHIVNINRMLKNAKTEVLVNFIRSDQANIIVVTNKAASSSDLVIIEKYIKNIDCIDVSGVQVPCLL